jgi:hypothetical protein
LKSDRIKKELGQLFENRFNCYAEPIDDVRLAMSEGQFFEIAGPIDVKFDEIADCETSYYHWENDVKILRFAKAISKERFVEVVSYFQKEKYLKSLDKWKNQI